LIPHLGMAWRDGQRHVGCGWPVAPTLNCGKTCGVLFTARRQNWKILEKCDD